jgi:hypothetical protein
MSWDEVLALVLNVSE